MSRAMLGLVIVLCAAGPARAAATNPPRPYAAIRAQLHASIVPVLLPVPLPRAIGAIRAVTVIAAGRTGYYVGFSPITHCGGALSCAFFHVAGSPRTPGADPLLRQGRPVRLPDGARGFFHPPDCSGASCTEASLTFARGDAVYELDAKVPRGSMAVLEQAYRALRSVR